MLWHSLAHGGSKGIMMANYLKMAKIQAIQGLLEQGWSQRRIARELCIDRKPPVKCIWTWGCVFWHDVFFGESSCQAVASTGDVRFRP